MKAAKRGTCTSARDSQSSSQASARAFFGGIVFLGLSGCGCMRNFKKNTVVLSEATSEEEVSRSGVMMSQPANISRVPPTTLVCSGS